MLPRTLVLLMAFLPCVLMDHGVVLQLGTVEPIRSPIHTWVQRDPDYSQTKGFYKLECSFSINPRDFYVVKILFRDSLLETLTVTRFDQPLLDSIKILPKDNERHRIRYEMTDGSKPSCVLRTYTPEKTHFTIDEGECGFEVRSMLWVKLSPLTGWKWDENDKSVNLQGLERGAVGQMSLHNHRHEGEPIHDWKHQTSGYVLSVRRVQDEGGAVTYLATLYYKGGVLDVVEVFSLGELLTQSITVLRREGNVHVVQYRRTDSCVQLQYKTDVGEQTAKKQSPHSLYFRDVVEEPEAHTCERLLIRKLVPVAKNLFLASESSNGWMW